jgi:nitrate reductase cytochrome c-type subunit
MSSNSIPEPARPNAQRIGTARSALSAAMWARGEDFPVCDEAVINLLADLRHFCMARHINFTACNAIVEDRFKTEIDGGPR